MRPALARCLISRVAIAIMVLPLISCDKSNPPEPDLSDRTPPAAVRDLSVMPIDHQSIRLSWTSVGDDSVTGTASEYDLRYSEMRSQPFNEMEPIQGEPIPKPAGQAEQMTMDSLESGKVYDFLMRVSDDSENWSAISNLVIIDMPFPIDSVAPASVNDLAVTEVTATTVTLGWTAVGDDGLDGTASYYDVRFSSHEIDEESWEEAEHALGEPSPSMPENEESYTIADLDAESAYHIRLRVYDDAGNDSGLSNEVVVTTRPVPHWEIVSLTDSGQLMALSSFDDKLVVAGEFTTAGGMGVNNIVAWDGLNWSDLGDGLSGTVKDLVTYSGTLYACGEFETTGSIEVNNVAAWDGTSWHALGTGLNGAALALATYGDGIAVSGSFSQAGDIECSYIAHWNGDTWSPLGGGLDWAPRHLQVYDGSLFAGGTSGSFSQWNGAEWVDLSLDWIDCFVYSMGVYESKLVIGGSFGELNNIVANNIAHWDGSQWGTFGNGILPDPILRSGVACMVEWRGDLYVGGQLLRGFERWTGAEWEAISPGPGTFFGSADITVFRDQIHACGGHVGDQGIAVWIE